MRTAQDIQKEVLATAQVTLDELKSLYRKVLGRGVEQIPTGSQSV